MLESTFFFARGRIDFKHHCSIRYWQKGKGCYQLCYQLLRISGVRAGSNAVFSLLLLLNYYRPQLYENLEVMCVRTGVRFTINWLFNTLNGEFEEPAI